VRDGIIENIHESMIRRSIIRDFAQEDIHSDGGHRAPNQEQPNSRPGVE
jgi:hypothetical protein